MERSLLLVHAHPDDESIGTGATMAKYAAEGARVTLVTCTLGELGEIIPPDLRHLFPDELGQHRIVELATACSALGVEDHRFLGGEGRYRDSGMMGLPDNDDPRCFWRADFDEAADALAKVINEVAADVIVTYDANGFYGHPDHIQAHRVARRAHELTGGTAKLYAAVMPRSVLARAVELPEDSWFMKNTGRSVAAPTTRSRRRSTRPPTWTPSGRRCAPMRPRSPWTATTSRCPTTLASGFSDASTTPGWRARGPNRPRPERHERDLFTRGNR